MFRSKTKKNATALEPGDVIILAGQKYTVRSNEQGVRVHIRHLVLNPPKIVTDLANDQVSLFIPAYLPMTIYKK